jgi:ribonuclease HI
MNVNIYTDGASSNGYGGYAAYLYFMCCGFKHEKQVSGRKLNTTNNEAELLAVKLAIDTISSSKDHHYTIHSDSKYVIDSLTNWYKSWQRNGWKNKSGKPVKNKKLILEIINAMKKLNIKFKWVKAHSGIHGNELVDKLAVKERQTLEGMHNGNKHSRVRKK